MLVTASLVAVRGLMRSFQTPLGFRPEGVIGYDVGLANYNEGQGRVFEQRAAEAAAHLPGVESAAYSSSVPPSIDDSTTTVYPENTTDFRPKNARHPLYYYVSPGYFRTAGTRLLAGRAFTLLDSRNSPLVAIVNRTLARSLTGTADAASRRFRMSSHKLYEIVGIVEDGKYESMTETPKGAVFFPILQNYTPTIVLMARSQRPEFEVDHRNLRAGRLHGIAAHAADRNTNGHWREPGADPAAGPRPHGRAGRVGGRGWAGGGRGRSQRVGHIVYQATSRDPVVIGAAVLSMACVGLGAVFGPACRALRVDPVLALRHE